MHYLGLDFGLRQIGVALATGPLAEPLITLSTQTALPALTRLITTHDIGLVVIGDAGGSVDGQLSDFIAQIEALNVPVVKIDETLSSRDSRAALLHTTPSRRRLKEHAVAAAIILQSWLDAQPHQ